MIFIPAHNLYCQQLSSSVLLMATSTIWVHVLLLEYWNSHHSSQIQRSHWMYQPSATSDTLIFLQEHLIVLPIIAKNNFEYHRFLGNCSYVLNFSNPIFVFLLLFLVIFFRSFILFRRLLISLWKVIFKSNSTKRILFQKKTFTSQQIIQFLRIKCRLLFLLLIYPRYNVLIFHDFTGVFLFPSSGSKMYHTNVLEISQKPMIFVLLICSCKKIWV